ncbi:hypothetical protein CcaverHIS002_0510920 [Cutaneotrichosporon cavernicola]|nr:hypothetical protein CcaverHIS002_0510920 [Cutaneotrichosporon cavernicola]
MSPTFSRSVHTPYTPQPLFTLERFWSVIHLSWMSEGIPMYNVQYHITPTDPLVHLVVQTIRHTLGIMSLEDKIEWIRHYGILQRRAGHSIPPEVVAWYILKGEEHYESVCNGSEDAPSESWCDNRCYGLARFVARLLPLLQGAGYPAEPSFGSVSWQ